MTALLLALLVMFGKLMAREIVTLALAVVAQGNRAQIVYSSCDQDRTVVTKKLTFNSTTTTINFDYGYRDFGSSHISKFTFTTIQMVQK